MSIVIPVERLWELYDYSPLTGELISKKLKRPLARIIDHKGYMRLTLRWHDGTGVRQTCSQYHRVVFAWCVGRWPEQGIDHVNRDRTDNRIGNLRDVTSRQNSANTKSFSGGATWHKQRKRWMAQIYCDNRTKYLGLFGTKEEAQKAYADALAALE